MCSTHHWTAGRLDQGLLVGGIMHSGICTDFIRPSPSPPPPPPSGLSILVYCGSAGALAAFAATIQFQHHFVVLYVLYGLVG